MLKNYMFDVDMFGIMTMSGIEIMVRLRIGIMMETEENNEIR